MPSQNDLSLASSVNRAIDATARLLADVRGKLLGRGFVGVGHVATLGRRADGSARAGLGAMVRPAARGARREVDAHRRGLVVLEPAISAAFKS